MAGNELDAAQDQERGDTLNLTIGLVGLGIMGRGIAEVMTLAGHRVVAMAGRRTPYETQRERYMNSLKRGLRRSGSDADPDAVAARLVEAPDWESFADCDFVIEAVTENLPVKAEILQSLSGVMRDDAVLATNTSSLSITSLAAIAGMPDRFIGLHFMNPAPLMKGVEVIRGFDTADDVFRRSVAMIESLGKTVVVSRDSPGFLLNRILIPMINEAIYTLSEGVGTVESIDTILVGAANHPMGPLELADLIGLDTCLAIMQVLHAELADPKYRPCPLLVKYVEAGWLGRKTKKGFYDYGQPGRPVTWPLAGAP